jgi:hypothetical protein
VGETEEPIFDTGLRVTPRLDEPDEPHDVRQIGDRCRGSMHESARGYEYAGPVGIRRPLRVRLELAALLHVDRH